MHITSSQLIYPLKKIQICAPWLTINAITVDIELFLGSKLPWCLRCNLWQTLNSDLPQCLWDINISRLASSQWGTWEKQHHWWRHNWNPDCQPFILTLRYDRVIVHIYDVYDQIESYRNVSACDTHRSDHVINSLPISVLCMNLQIDDMKILSISDS